ncbi:MAG: prolipoprotein diacylglyceryl transferase [Flavobacteriales bacterium]|nr:prolipoprotein diacylglyceryl transferase [Flavobacteriales bacterium]
MYPTLYHALFDLTGLDWPVLKFLNSFGFFVALAFMGAYWTLVQELKRKEGIGLIKATTRTVMVGEGAKPAELAMQGLMGFIVGWKGLYILLNTAEVTADPPGFLLSGTGSFIGGIAVAALFVWLLWREKEKQRLKEPKKETVTIHPAQHGGNITITAALWGFIGAKVFHWIESPRDFLDLINTGNIRDLISGLTMYGGLIVAGIMVIRYFKKNGMAILPSMDAAAPGLMLAYGIGRLGCQVVTMATGDREHRAQAGLDPTVALELRLSEQRERRPWCAPWRLCRRAHDQRHHLSGLRHTSGAGRLPNPAV